MASNDEHGSGRPLFAAGLGVVVGGCTAVWADSGLLWVPFAVGIVHAMLAPILWFFSRRRAHVGLVPLTVLAAQATLWLALVTYARALPRFTPEGTRIRGSGLGVVLAVHPFIAVTLAVVSLAIAGGLAFVSRRMGHGRHTGRGPER